MRVIKGKNGNIAVFEEKGCIAVPQDVRDAVGLMFGEECSAGVFLKACLPESFFELRSGFAGDMLQTLVNYRFRVAVVGDFSIYSSAALRDFIYESNKGGSVRFAADEAEAVRWAEEG